MNKIQERQNRILEILHDNDRMEVADLARETGVSLVTMRKDLNALEEKKLIRREQGYAQINTDTPLNRRILTNYALKQRIAKSAAGMVSDGDTIMIEAGSCCLLFAQELAQSKKDLTIITNSVYMAGQIGTYPNVHIILSGGDYQPDSMDLVGPAAITSLSTFHVKYFFSGTDGYDPEKGFTGDNLQRVEVLNKMASCADVTVLLIESSKFKQQGVLPLYRPEDIQLLVTDNQIPEKIEDDLTTQGIMILKAEADQ